MTKILVADDDTVMLGLLKTLLELEGLEVISVIRQDEIFPAVEKDKPAMILMDFHLAGGNALKALETLKNKWFTLNKQEKAEIFRMMTCQRELGNEKTGKLLIKWEKPWDALSLIPKRVNGVGNGGFNGLEGDC